MQVAFQCVDCRHYHGPKTDTCDAFPKGIPTAILFGQHDHRKPFPGDHGIRFESKEPHVNDR